MSWILDVLFFVLIIAGILFGVKNGFINGVCKIAGTILAIAVAVLFSNGFAQGVGLSTALGNAIGNARIGGWIAVAISFVILAVLTKLATWLLGKLGTFLAERVKTFDLLNKLFGGLLGLFQALIVIFILLAICYWIAVMGNVTPMRNFIESSTVVGAIFRWQFFINLAQFKFVIVQ